MSAHDYISAAILCLALCLIWGNIVARREDNVGVSAPTEIRKNKKHGTPD